MMMKKGILLKLLILIMIASLFVGILLACDDTDTDDPAENVPGAVESIGKSEILSNLADRLDNTIQLVDKQKSENGVVSLLSNYAFMAEDLKYTITYNVNYDYATKTGSRSDIYLKIYDEEYSETRVMFYYKNGTLYTDIDGERSKITDFGSSGMFNVFYAFVSYFDMSTIVVDKDFASSVEELDSYIESKKITQFKTGENGDNISLKGVNFDTKKGTVNDLLTSAFGRFGTTYDAIAEKILGVKLSRLAEMQIMTLDANLVEFYSTDGIFNKTAFNFGGMLESKWDFSLVGSFEIGSERKDLDVSEWDEEDEVMGAIEKYTIEHKLDNDSKQSYIDRYTYKTVDISRNMYEGVFALNILGTSYDVELFYDYDQNNDKNSELSLRLYDQGTTAASAYYHNGEGYLDLGDLYDSFNVALGLKDFNFPRVSSTTFNLKNVIDQAYELLDLLVRDMFATSKEQQSGMWDIIQEKVVTTDTVTTLYVDKKLLTSVNALRDEPYTEANVAVFIADLLGVERSTIEEYFTGDEFDTLRILVSFDTKDSSWQIKLQMTATEADAKSIKSVDVAPELYTDIGDILPLSSKLTAKLSSKLTANSTDYYYYQYSGILYANKQRSVVKGSYKGDLNKIWITTGGEENVYTFGTATYGIAELLNDAGTAVGKYYTAQEYMTIGDTTYYYTRDKYAPKELYSDPERTKVVNNLDYDKYMFKVENMYYYLGQSATYYLGYLSAGNFDIFTGTFTIASTVYNFGNGISYRKGETVGVINPQDKIVITSSSPSQIFIKKTTEKGKIGLYKEGDESQTIVGYYNAESLSIEFTSGQFEDEIYLIDVDNNLMRMYGTVDMTEKQVVINDYKYNLNYGLVFSTQEGIDDLMTLDLVETDEVRQLYTEKGVMYTKEESGYTKVSIKGADGSTNTYYFIDGQTSVFTAPGGTTVAGASYDVRRATIMINGVEYLLGSIKLTDGAKEVGLVDVVDGLVKIDNTVYQIAENMLVGLEKAGEMTLDDKYLLYNGNIDEIFTLLSNRLYDKDSQEVGFYDGTSIEFESGSFAGNKYVNINGELRQLHGTISLDACVVTVSGKQYDIAESSPIYLIEGEYQFDQKYIQLLGVRYYVESGNIYTDTSKVMPVGTVDDVLGEIVINGTKYFYKQSAIEVLRHSYKPASYPEDLGFRFFSGEITLSQVNQLDISKFLGAFIGDSTGINTPYTLKLGEKLTYEIKMAYHNDVLSMYAHLAHVDSNNNLIKDLVTIVTANNQEGDLLVDYNVMGELLKFRSTADQILAALRAFAGDNSVFNAEGATDALYKIFEYAEISFMEDGMAYSIVYDTATGTDPIKELIGLEKLSSTGKFGIDYDMVIPEVNGVNIDDYQVPTINMPTAPVVRESIHEVNWIRTVDVILGDKKFEGMTIPYIESTVTIVDGKTVYEPTASLFGKTISYQLILTGENGTSAVTDIVGGMIEIDPWAENPKPLKISVYFDNGSVGEVRYTIVGFDDNTISEYGNAIWDSERFMATYPTYEVIVSSGSIGEVTFKNVPVIVKCRLLSDVKDTSGTTDIVATTTIDPYDYDSVNYNKLDGEMTLSSSSNTEGLDEKEERYFIRWENGQKTLWSHMPIEFYSYYTLENSQLKEMSNFLIKWDFDFNNISFRGGEYLAKALEIYKEKLDENGMPVVDEDGNTVYEQCATKDIATTVHISTKVAAYLSLYNIKTGVKENDGSYTVDSLKQETYTIPTRSTDDYMILVYFSDGRFRVIGDETIKDLFVREGLIAESYCDGVFNIALDWTYDVADYITIYGTTSPLGGGRASVNSAILASGSIGSQTLSLTVTEPSREVLITGSETGYTSIEIVGDVVSRTENVFFYNTVSWTGDSLGVDKPFEINPYKFNSTPLPQEVTVAVNEARGEGQYAIKYYTYPIIEWNLSTNILQKGGDNRYYLRYPTSEGANFKAEAIIGDGQITTTISVVIRNMDAEYLYYEFEGYGKKQEGEKTVIDVNAYSPYTLPNSFSIYIDGVDEPMTYEFGQFTWYIDYGQDTAKHITMYRDDFSIDPTGKEFILWSDTTYQAFDNFIKNGEGTFDQRWIDGRYYFFDNVAKEITLTAYIKSSVDGELEQKLELTLNVVEMSNFKLSTELFKSQSSDGKTVNIDTYAQESAMLIKYLQHKTVSENYVSVLPIEMFSTSKTATYVYYVPMNWEEGNSYDRLLDALLAKGQQSTSIAINGTTVLGDSDISLTFECIDRRIASNNSFYFRALTTIDQEILTVNYVLTADGEKSLNIELKKPYALSLKSNNVSEYALPSTFFKAALKDISMIFMSADFANYTTDVEGIIDGGLYKDGVLYDFDQLVLDFEENGLEVDSQVSFAIKMGEGSASDSITVNILTRADSIQSKPSGYQVDIYTNDGIGSPKYLNGYTIPTDYVVEYTNSGRVVYTDLTWKTDIASSAEITKIDRSELSNEAKVFTLYSNLPDGSPITLSIIFSAKNIGGTNYDASTYHDGTTGTETVEAINGIIALDNIYELYDLMLLQGETRVFDITKLPNVLLPYQTDTYTDSARIDGGTPITFRVVWNTNNFFKIDPNGNITCSSTVEKDGLTIYKIAEAQITGYNNVSQTVSLHITIASKNIVSISAEGYDFRYDDVEKKQYLYIDPYEEIMVDGKPYYIWQKALPQNVILTLGDNTTYTFSGNQLTYTSADLEITRFDYNYKQFTDTNSNQKVVKLHLPNGSTFEFTAVIIDRSYQEVQLPYVDLDGGIKYVSGTYFIDPYNKSTFTVPTNVDVVFDNGEKSNLTLAWDKFSDAARVDKIDDITISYLGATYYYRATLAAYTYVDGQLVAISANDNQHVDIQVVVLNRSVKDGVSYEVSNGETKLLTAQGVDNIFRIDRLFSVIYGEDYIGRRLEDIYPKSAYNSNMFVELPASCPADFMVSYPTIYWADGIEDDAIKGGLDGTEAINGYLGGDKKIGQQVKVYLTTDILTIEDFDLTTVEDAPGGTAMIYFNAYTNDSVGDTYGFIFGVKSFVNGDWVEMPDTTITFFTKFVHENDVEKSRHLIYWAEALSNNGSVEISTFTLGNATKEGRIDSTGKVWFRSKPLTIRYTRVDLGLGKTDNTNGNASFVIDPLQPYLPTSLSSAEGWFYLGSTIGKTTEELEIIKTKYAIIGDEYGVWLPLGEVNITWKDSDNNGIVDALQDLTYSNAGQQAITRTVYAIVNAKGREGDIPLNFTMYYLDRTPKAILTDQRENIGFGVSSGLYPGYNDLTTSSGISIDPLNNYANGSYHLMTKVNLRFEYNYDSLDADQVLLYKAVNYYGTSIDVTGLNIANWYLGLTGITIEGTTTPINASLISGVVVGKEGKTYNVNLPRDIYVVEINVKNRAISSTSISSIDNYDKETKSFVVVNPKDGSVDYSIDPYNASLPRDIRITFGTGNEAMTNIYNFELTLDGRLPFTDGTIGRLSNPTVINGTAPQEEMTVTAYIDICGERYNFIFNIKPRPIDLEDEDITDIVEVPNEGRMINGGTIYILAVNDQLAAIEQLPQYMYYDFGTKDYTRVPIEYNASDILGLTKAGTYNVRATLGITEDGYNIIFEVVVVDAKLYEIRTVTDAFGNVQASTMYDLVYDKIIASVSTSGERLEDLDSMWLPQYISLVEGTELAIEDVIFDLKANTVAFTCYYAFQDDTRNFVLAGDADGNKIFEFKLTMALVINQVDNYVGTATLEKNTVHYALGTEIDLTSLPKAVYNEQEYYVYWDVTGRLGGDVVDKYKAGSYNIYGEVLTGLRDVQRFSLTVVIDKIDISDVATIATNDLNYKYTGQARGDWQNKISFVGTIFIDENGEEYTPEITFEFSEDGLNWIEGVEFLNVGTYYIKASIDDINVTGERVFTINISPTEINGNEITFENTTVTYTGTPQEPTILYAGQPLSSHIRYHFTFYRYEENGRVEYQYAINASNSDGYGAYVAELTFEDNPNYNFSSVSGKEVTFTILKKKAMFALEEERVYSGNYEHIAIDGLPSTYLAEGVKVYYTYTYTDGPNTLTTSNAIKNVGTYKVLVTIDGGNNYESASLARTEYVVKPAKLTVVIGDITCTYPEIAPLNPTITYVGKVGGDTSIPNDNLFGAINVFSTMGNYPVPGEYLIEAKGLHNDNYEISYDFGTYTVELPTGVTPLVLEEGQSLQDVIDNATGNTLKLYLPKGNYGSLNIDKKGMAIALIGERNVDDGTYSATFTSINLTNGSLELSAIGFMAEKNTVSLTLSQGAGNVILSSVTFYGETYDSISALEGSVAMEVSIGYKSLLTINKVEIKHRVMGLSVYSGSVVMADSTISYTAAGIAMHGGSISMVNTKIAHSTAYGLYFASVNLIGNYELVNNRFENNTVAIRYISLISLETDASVVSGNTYINNQSNLSKQ